MPLFLSTHVNKVDKKGRVSVPAPYRSALAGQGWEGVVCLPSLVNPALDGCDLAFMEKLSADQSQGMQAFGRSKDAFSSAVFAASRQLPFDSEGRIILPEPFIKHAGISEAACFVGQGATFQIWEPARFEAYQKEAWQAVAAEQKSGGGR
jgi:transcriptional regulator MraZ